MSDAAYTYFIFQASLGRWKIGRSTCVLKRAAQLCLRNKGAVLVTAFPFSKFTEGQCHRMFSEFRLEGEWFKDCPEIRAFLEAAGPGEIPEDLNATKYINAPVPVDIYEKVREAAFISRVSMGGFIASLVVSYFSSPKPSK
jgi:hypothetical protein